QAAPCVIDHLRRRIEELLLEIVQRGLIELELPLEGAVSQASAPLEHGDRLVDHLFKGHRPPSRGRGGVQKTVWEWDRPFDACISDQGNKRKQEVLGARDAEVTPFSQTRRGWVTCAWTDCHRHRPL